MFIIKKQSNLIKSLLIIFFSLMFFTCTKAKYTFICDNPEYSNKIFVLMEHDNYDNEVDFYLRASLSDLNLMFNKNLSLEAGPNDYIELKGIYNKEKKRITHNELLKNFIIFFQKEHEELKILNTVREEELNFYREEGREKFFKNKNIIPYKQAGLYLSGYVKEILVEGDRKLLLLVKDYNNDYEYYRRVSFSASGISLSYYDKDADINQSTSPEVLQSLNMYVKSNYYDVCKKNKEVTENNPVIKKIIWDDVEKFKAEFLKENHLDDKYFNYNCLCYNEGPDYTTAFYTIWDGDAEYTTTVLKTDKAGNIILQDVLFPDEKKSVLGAFTVTSDSYLLLIYDSYTDTTWVNIFKF